MVLYDLSAPAKLNLFLHVVGRRADGYHELQSLFRLITLSDSVTVELRLDGQISREGELLDQVAEEADLTMRAAHALRAATGTVLGAHIHVLKRIPSGAGLGGGSSDAATVLLALNKLWRTGLSRETLMSIGARLGADVPFFIFGQTGFVQGVGEKIVKSRLPECSYLLFKPHISISTATVFQDERLTRDTKSIKIMDFSGCKRFVATDTKSEKILGFGRNDLEAVVLKQHVAVSQLKNQLSQWGFSTRMTGSGSCLFSEKNNPESAQFAFKELLVKIQAENAASNREFSDVLESVYVCDGLDQHPLYDWV
ncbi:4-(cytidine 5'-diphospho)-2-C-methyl-D-erythritol kinase [Orrella sp. 11846]|uniref:4-(cytidine 5'-diphospho)-2-C-methyl-D-erythritol kinase n=1 Tax=Orrella sp. 11846 TaxID=3409913 RepID=UPI003B5CA230